MNHPERQGYATLRGNGLDWDSLPLRLMSKGNKKFWNPEDIDLSRERRDWEGLPEGDREGALRLCALFAAGEEAVTQDIHPFISAVSREGRIADELYLTQFANEEARHAVAFRRWLDAVGATDDLHGFVAENSAYSSLLNDRLPSALHALDDDPSPANQVRASVTYNHVLEGSLALTGYFAWNLVCMRQRIFPGMRQIIKHINDDERRHMAWGTYTCRRHVAADERNWTIVRTELDDLLPLVQRAVELTQAPPGTAPGTDGPEDPDDLVGYASERLLRRLGTIESALGEPYEAVASDISPERLEDDLYADDLRRLKNV